MIVIIDYGMGNLGSIYNALRKFSNRVVISEKLEDVDKAQGVVLPGVGAFGDAINNLQTTGMDTKIKEYISQNKPFLGICLGFQLLFEKSYEDGIHKGLGIFQGDVVSFKEYLPSNYKVPHMGWNEVRGIFNDKIFFNINEGDYFYFVHSYFVNSSCEFIKKIYTFYGIKFISGIVYNNLYAFQFHPEKSQRKGLALIKNFVDIVEKRDYS